MDDTDLGLNPTPPAIPPGNARKQRSIIPAIGFVVVSILGWCSLKLSGTPSGVLEPVYRSIGLFTGNGSWAFEKTSHTDAWFRIFAILAPLLTALGITELVTGALGPLWVRLVSFIKRLWRRPVAIFGLDENSLEFARTVAQSGEYLPMIFAQIPDERIARQAMRRFIPIIPHTTPWWGRLRNFYFWLLGLQDTAAVERIVLPRRVEDIVSFLPTAGAQVDLAAKLTRRKDVGDNRAHLRARLLVADRGLAQRLDDYLKYSLGNDIYPRLIDLDTLAARLLLTTHPLDMLADAFNQEQIHLAIYGFGSLGRAVAKETARLYVTRSSLNNIKVRITVIDRNPDALAAFLAEDPEIDDVLQLELKPSVGIARAGFSANDVAMVIPEDVTAHVIAFGSTQAAFTAAVSLRRWLLEPPGSLGPDWRSRHRSSPIFVRALDWTGLGRLIRSGVDYKKRIAAELPDGIFAFGTREALFSPDALLAPQREEAAKRTHEAYSSTLKSIREKDPATPSRVAEKEWDELTPQIRDSNFYVVDHLAIKARACGYRLVDRKPGDTSSVWRPATQAVVELQHLEHRRWIAERRANGWRYAASRCDAVRVHPDLVAWDHLTALEKQLDEKQIYAMPGIADALQKRLAEALVVGVVGHRPDPNRIDPDHVKRRLSETLTAIIADNPHRAVVVLTALAPGTDTWAAEEALNLNIPFIVPLPLPFELYREDFTETRDRETFHWLIAQAEYYIELPLRFGCVSELTIGTGRDVPLANKDRRAQQYALAGAYIVERAHTLIGVWDKEVSGGVGGTGDVLSWKTSQEIPVAYQTTAKMLPRPQTLEQIQIPAKPGL